MGARAHAIIDKHTFTFTAIVDDKCEDNFEQHSSELFGSGLMTMSKFHHHLNSTTFILHKISFRTIYVEKYFLFFFFIFNCYAYRDLYVLCRKLNDWLNSMINVLWRSHYSASFLRPIVTTQNTCYGNFVTPKNVKCDLWAFITKKKKQTDKCP